MALLTMKKLDTGRIEIEPRDDKYLLFTIYEDGELLEEDMVLVRDYLDQYEDKVSIVIVKNGENWLAPGAITTMYMDAAARIKAVVYLNREYDANYAAQSYLHGIKVTSCRTLEEAVQWVEQFGPLPKPRTL